MLCGNSTIWDGGKQYSMALCSCLFFRLPLIDYREVGLGIGTWSITKNQQALFLIPENDWFLAQDLMRYEANHRDLGPQLLATPQLFCGKDCRLWWIMFSWFRVLLFLIREVFFLLGGASGSEDRLRENIVNEWTDGWMGSEQSCGFSFLIMLAGIFKQCIWKGIWYFFVPFIGRGVAGMETLVWFDAFKGVWRECTCEEKCGLDPLEWNEKWKVFGYRKEGRGR